MIEQHNGKASGRSRACSGASRNRPPCRPPLADDDAPRNRLVDPVQCAGVDRDEPVARQFAQRLHARMRRGRGSASTVPTDDAPTWAFESDAEHLHEQPATPRPRIASPGHSWRVRPNASAAATARGANGSASSCASTFAEPSGITPEPRRRSEQSIRDFGNRPVTELPAATTMMRRHTPPHAPAPARVPGDRDLPPARPDAFATRTSSTRHNRCARSPSPPRTRARHASRELPKRIEPPETSFLFCHEHVAGKITISLLSMTFAASATAIRRMCAQAGPLPFPAATGQLPKSRMDCWDRRRVWQLSRSVRRTFWRTSLHCRLHRAPWRRRWHSAGHASYGRDLHAAPRRRGCSCRCSASGSMPTSCIICGHR